MGLVLDSGVVITAERDLCPVSELLTTLEHVHGETDILLSVISVTEARREHLDTAFAAIPIEPFSREMALLAAKIDAEARQFGRHYSFADLLIGVTALHYGYAVGTRNLRHFHMIPNLAVIQL